MMEKIIKRLQELTKEKNWSSYRLAKECDLSENVASHVIKKGKPPSLETLCAMCKGLEVSMSEFFSFENDVTVHLNGEETELVECYRRVPEGERKHILGYLQGLSGKTI